MIFSFFTKKTKLESPYCFRLSKEEKSSTLALARLALLNFLEKKSISETKKDFKKELCNDDFRTDLCVALWVEGKLRGSCVIEGKTLKEGVIRGIIRAARDLRFKPIEISEFPNIRIQITLISNVKNKVLKRKIDEYIINPINGYKISYFNKKSWFLPEVFNVIKFKNSINFLSELSKKAHLERIKIINPNFKINAFDVCDFIESDDHDMLELEGPMCKKKPLNKTLAEKGIRSSISWILKIQENDGYFPSGFHALSGKNDIRMDWVKSAFLSLSLAKYGEIFKDENCLLSAKKNTAYINKYLIEEKINVPYLPLALSYLGRSFLILNDVKKSFLCEKRINEIIHRENIDLFSAQQLAILYLSLSKYKNAFLKKGIVFFKKSKLIFEKNKNNPKTEFAFYADLVILSLRIYNVTLDEKYVNFANNIIDWILKNQSDTGFFFISANNKNANTRTTSKILEMLSFAAAHDKISDRNRKLCIKSLLEGMTWILSMQYDKENTFFIDYKHREKLFGGIRHSYFDQDAQIDSVGHILICYSRLKNNNISIT